METGRSYFPLVAPAHVPALGADNFVDLTPDDKFDADTLEFAEFVAPATGSASTYTLTFGGTWAAGENITHTINSNVPGREVWSKPYRYEVQPGDTPTTIATYFLNAINNDGNHDECPYTASIGGSVVTIVAKEKYKIALLPFTGFVSTSGTLVTSAVSTTRSHGTVADLERFGVDASVITLTSYDTVRIVLKPLNQDSGLTANTIPKREILWFGTPGNGAGLATLINTL